MKNEGFDVVFKEGRSPMAGQYLGRNPRRVVDQEAGITCDYDVAVRMTDGTKIYVDVVRPINSGKCPVLIAWGPYGKHNPDHIKYAAFAQRRKGATGVSDAELSPFCIFEGPDPNYWCPYGYAIMHADPRGTWGSGGNLTFMTKQEAKDFYDLIEWAGVQGWSNGKVGLIGVSYLAWSQWKVAALNPPHLAAINPTDGSSDFYRELAFHGGIPCDYVSFISNTWNFSSGQAEDLEEMSRRHPLFDEYWSGKNANLSDIKVPAYVVTSWGDHGLHLRGTIEAFRKISSKEKWLKVHGRKLWDNFYQNQERQRQFFDKFLKGIESEVTYWPKVALEIRERYYQGNTRSENEWPLSRTEYRKLYMDPVNGKLSNSQINDEGEISYDSTRESAVLDFTFDTNTEITGYMKLKLWVEAADSDDMDLFVIIDKFDRTGDRVPFPMRTTDSKGAVTYGWLRVSHREMDPQRSTPFQPFHPHQREVKLKNGEIVPVEIEIWPSSTLFHEGERLRLTVAGHDIEVSKDFMHTNTVNRGKHIIHSGGKYDSHLLIPVIP